MRKQLNAVPDFIIAYNSTAQEIQLNTTVRFYNDTYKLISFNEYRKFDKKTGHYLAYKMLDERWLCLDDTFVDYLGSPNPRYTSTLMIYRREEFMIESSIDEITDYDIVAAVSSPFAGMTL